MEVRDDGELEQGRLGGGQGLGMGWRQRGQWREERRTWETEVDGQGGEKREEGAGWQGQGNGISTVTLETRARVEDEPRQDGGGRRRERG
eukprot:1243034-Rhodomonas_salina.3